MQFIRHRVNKIQDLKSVDPSHGVEIDLRSDLSVPDTLHLSHDAWVRGDDFSAWLKEFKRLKIEGPILLNTKEDGLESTILSRLEQESLSHFFFLDTTLPTLHKLTEKNLGQVCSVRFSAIEPLEGVLVFKNKVKWVWVDCFHGVPMPAAEVAKLKSFFSICLVSPEMQGQSTERIAQFKELYAIADAICSKQPQQWIKAFA